MNYSISKAALLFAALLLQFCFQSSCGFSTTVTTIRPTNKKLSVNSLQQKPRKTTTQLPAAMINMETFENWLYQSQTAANVLAQGSLESGGSFPILYLAGLLTSFSPCVWGLLPVTVSYISQATEERDDQNAMYPTVAFALGLTFVFCSLGVAATQVGGAVMGSDNQTMGVLSNLVCFIMGLKILELIDIPLPNLNFRDKVLNNGSSKSDQPILIDATGQILTSAAPKEDEGASLFRTFLLGGSSALAASPCATPVLTSILAFVANSAADASAAYGAFLLLAYSIGYATPLLLVAGTGGQALTKLRSNGFDAIGPWVTPITGAILLWCGTTGLLTSVFGDPSLFGLPVLE